MLGGFSGFDQGGGGRGGRGGRGGMGGRRGGYNNSGFSVFGGGDARFQVGHCLFASADVCKVCPYVLFIYGTYKKYVQL